MTVKELIEFLQTQPQDLPVAYELYREYAMLHSTDQIKVIEACLPREDFWIARERPDRPTQRYLTFPGN